MKYLRSVILVLMSILMLSGVTVNAAESGYLRGDADSDGEITITDATVIQRFLNDMDIPVFHEEAADVNGGGVDISDATWLQRFHAEFPDPYRIGERVTDTPDPTVDEYELPIIPKK